MINVYALCTGYIELDRASMLSDLEPGQPWTVPVLLRTRRSRVRH